MKGNGDVKIRMDRVYLERFEFIRYFLHEESISYEKFRCLDLGCRNMELREILGLKNYTGVDFYEGIEKMPDGCYLNLEQPLPFSNGEFDMVFALDVLEHLENLHACLSEIRRVSRQCILIGLPNMYHYTYRLKFLFGRPLGTKYNLLPNSIMDRHRWIFTINEARNLIFKEFRMCKDISQWGHRIPYKQRSLRFLDSLVSNPMLGGYTIFFLIKMN